MKRKVLIVVHQLNVGGVQKALLSALNAIDYSQNEVTLYVRKARLDLLPFVNSKVSHIVINDDNMHYYRKPYAIYLQIILLNRKLFGLDASLYREKLVSYLVDSQMRYEKRRFFSDNPEYDVAIGYIQGYTAQFVAEKIHAKRKIMFFHGSTDETHSLHERIMDKFSSIFCVSEGALKELQRLYPPYAARMKCLENIVDAAKVWNDSNAFIVNKAKTGVTLCSCGRFTPVKGFDIAVEVASILKNNDSPFVWYFVGDGPERQKLEDRIASLGLEENIILTGMQGNPFPYIKACDIYVQPSKEESQGLTIIEAQILLRPVVSTRTVGGISLVQDGINGLLADIDASSLANAILILAKDTEARKRMQQALEAIDYEEKEQSFKQRWAKLLEGC